MNEFIEKLIGRLENEAYDMEICEEQFDMNSPYFMDIPYKMVKLDDIKEIVNQLAEEYKPNTNDAWKIVYDKVCNLEKEYAQKNNMESVNDCIRLENLLQYFKEELRSTEEYKGGWIPVSSGNPKETGLYQVTVDDNDEPVITAMYLAEVDIWSYHAGYGSYMKVLAWRSLPQPYQPKGE